jgi:hypothetical protein
MAEIDPVGPAPEAGEPRFLWLLFGASAAPLAWLGQMMLAYGVTATICYPGDHPMRLTAHSTLLPSLIVVDLLALALCAAGSWVSWRLRKQVRSGRNRFLALWGILSSLWFAAAILFNAIASFVPPCLS